MMTFERAALLCVYRAASWFFYGTQDHADWMYERVQRPKNCYVLFRNLLNYYLRLPRIHGIVSLVLEPVNACNLRCTYCFWGQLENAMDGRRPSYMDWDTFRRAIDLAPSTVETVTLAGMGEPLMHPEIARMVDYIADHGMRPIIFTNGTLLKGDKLAQLARSKLAVLNISIEPDAATAKELRGVDLACIRESVLDFLRVRRPEIEVKLSLVAHPKSVDLLGKVRAQWPDDISEIKVNAQFGFDGSDCSTSSCTEPWRGNLSVFTDGLVTPCCIDALEDLVIGDILKESYADMVTGPALRALLERLLQGDLPTRCTSCTQFSAANVPSRFPRGWRWRRRT